MDHWTILCLPINMYLISTAILFSISMGNLGTFSMFILGDISHSSSLKKATRCLATYQIVNYVRVTIEIRLVFDSKVFVYSTGY